jgi:hypothetical protein
MIIPLSTVHQEREVRGAKPGGVQLGGGEQEVEEEAEAGHQEEDGNKPNVHLTKIENQLHHVLDTDALSESCA